MGFPEVSFKVQRTKHISPFPSVQIESPCANSCASSVWKGPKTVPSVAPSGLGWLMFSTRVESPRVSESRMNSCRWKC
jgi:hypothetical protein